MGEIIEFPSNGSTAQGYLAEPAGGTGPGLVVIQEWWGLNDNIKDISDRFAAEGFFALSPDLYHGKEAAEPDEAMKLMMGLNIEQAAKDIGGAIDEVSKRSGGGDIGITGFCMGGGLTLLLAAQRPDKVAAAVPFYGVLAGTSAKPDWPNMRAAVQGHYAEDDAFASPDATRALEKELKDLGKEVDMFIYGGTHHGFFNDTREAHAPEASSQAWGRTLTFFKSKLSR